MAGPGSNPAPVTADRVPRDGQAQSGPAGRPGTGLIHPVETVEYLGQVLLRDTYPRIPHLKQDLICVPID